MSMQLKVNDKEYTVTYKFKAMYDSEFIKEMFETFNNMNSEDDIAELKCLHIELKRLQICC